MAITATDDVLPDSVDKHNSSAAAAVNNDPKPKTLSKSMLSPLLALLSSMRALPSMTSGQLDWTTAMIE